MKIKSLTKIIDQNALEFLAFGENFIMDRLTARNLNENLENNLYSKVKEVITPYGRSGS